LFSTRDDSPNRERARTAVIESLERGVPALYEVEESSLIVGYDDQGFLLRRHAAKSDGYEPMDRWPWLVGIAKRRTLASASGTRGLWRDPARGRCAPARSRGLPSSPLQGGRAC